MSDELVVAASELARDAGTGLTFHLSPTDADAASYLARTGRRPLVHLDALGVLGPHVLLAHAVHLDDAEVDDRARHRRRRRRLPVGVPAPRAGRRAGRPPPRARRARRARRPRLRLARTPATRSTSCVPRRSPPVSPSTPARAPFGAHAALELATIRGAEAIGMGDEIGSLEAGKRADVVVVDTTGPNWVPRSPDPVLQLVWASDGRDVRHVVAAGRVVVRDGECTTVDRRRPGRRGRRPPAPPARRRRPTTGAPLARVSQRPASVDPRRLTTSAWPGQLRLR